MASNPTTEVELQDLPGKDLAKDHIIQDESLRHSLDVQEHEEQPENHDPKYVPDEILEDTLLALTTSDCGPSAASGWSCHWSVGSALSGEYPSTLTALSAVLRCIQC